ncbi:hypothetical protein L1987_84921 [Smallanthus sonchifolius]|uniref:Uncharacterized protein n=1 Tax=Smallanthus sonchifolius TaxID=185202 RepID=A0ACB8XUK0_9ASTR|nr:hypothetical protein L1987_84921 [Smallanthus sonchifolius]
MEGVPLALRDEDNYLKVTEIFGRSVDDGVFSWGNIDISSGYYLVLTKIGNRIEEEINLVWQNRVYPVWVSEVGDSWVPEFNDAQPALVDEERVHGHGGDSREKCASKEAAHVSSEAHRSPGGPSLMVDHLLEEPITYGPVSGMGLNSVLNSKKGREVQLEGLSAMASSGVNSLVSNSVLGDTGGNANPIFQEVEDIVRMGLGLGFK